MAEVHRLSGEKVKPSEATGNPDVIAQLEWMLAEARAGRLTAFMAVMREEAGIKTASCGIWMGGFFEAIGALTILQIDMSNGCRKDD